MKLVEKSLRRKTRQNDLRRRVLVNNFLREHRNKCKKSVETFSPECSKRNTPPEDEVTDTSGQEATSRRLTASEGINILATLRRHRSSLGVKRRVLTRHRSLSLNDTVYEKHDIVSEQSQQDGREYHFSRTNDPSDEDTCECRTLQFLEPTSYLQQPQEAQKITRRTCGKQAPDKDSFKMFTLKKESQVSCAQSRQATCSDTLSDIEQPQESHASLSCSQHCPNKESIVICTDTLKNKYQAIGTPRQIREKISMNTGIKQPQESRKKRNQQDNGSLMRTDIRESQASCTQRDVLELSHTEQPKEAHCGQQLQDMESLINCTDTGMIEQAPEKESNTAILKRMRSTVRETARKLKSYPTIGNLTDLTDFEMCACDSGTCPIRHTSSLKSMKSISVCKINSRSHNIGSQLKSKSKLLKKKVLSAFNESRSHMKHPQPT